MKEFKGYLLVHIVSDATNELSKESLVEMTNDHPHCYDVELTQPSQTIVK